MAVSRQNFHRKAYFVLLSLLLVATTCSNFVMNLAWVFLSLNWIIEGDFRRKASRLVSCRLLHAYLALFLLLCVGMFWSSCWSYGLDYLRKMMPLLFVPLVVLTSEPVSRTDLQRLLILYVTAVFVVSIIGLVRCIAMPNLPYREIVPFISHIRFSLNVCFSIVLLLYEAVRLVSRRKVWRVAGCLVLVCWFLYFLLLLQSYTAYVVLFVVAAVVLPAYLLRRLSRGWRWCVVLMFVMLVGGVGGAVVSMVRDYYNLIPLARKPLASCTENGAAYRHEQDGLIENGNFVNNYICEEELSRAWLARTGESIYGRNDDGYETVWTLIRYLNAKGLTKDSVGVWCRTEQELASISSGIANPIYLRRASLRKMVYVMLYVKDSYVIEGKVAGSSVMQRVELWRASCRVLSRHWLFGVGTGDVVEACHAELRSMQSSLADNAMHPHCQYLSLLLAFGVLGFCVVSFLFVRAFVGAGAKADVLLVAHVVIVLVSFVSEDTLETLAGCMFVVALNVVLSAASVTREGKTRDASSFTDEKSLLN